MSSLIGKTKHAGVWVFCEIINGKIQDVSLEMLGIGSQLAEQRGHKLYAVILGHQTEPYVHTAWEYGADIIIDVDDSSLQYFNDEDYAAILLRLLRKYKPEIFLAGATANGRALVPRLAVLAHCGLTADCTGLAIDQETGALLQTRPAFGGSLMATIRSDGFLPQLSTVRPGVMKAMKRKNAHPYELIKEKIIASDSTNHKKMLEIINEKSTETLQSNAHVVIAGGRGMGGKKGFDLLKKLASMVDGAVGASRAAVDAGWVSYGIQIGQTGQTVQSRVYIACGISGQMQHLVGMSSSNLIIAINTDRNAPIMKMADIAIVGDVFEIITKLIKMFETIKG